MIAYNYKPLNYDLIEKSIGFAPEREQLLPFNVNPDELEDMRNIPKLIFPAKEAVD